MHRLELICCAGLMVTVMVLSDALLPLTSPAAPIPNVSWSEPYDAGQLSDGVMISAEEFFTNWHM